MADHDDITNMQLLVQQQPAMIMPEMLQAGSMLPAAAPAVMQEKEQQYLMFQLQQQAYMQQMMQEQMQQAVAAVPLNSALAAVDKLDASCHKQLLKQIMRQHPEARALVTQRLAAEQNKPVHLKQFGSAAWHALHQLDDLSPHHQHNQSRTVAEALQTIINRAAALPNPK
jgi:hypothetical protein